MGDSKGNWASGHVTVSQGSIVLHATAGTPAVGFHVPCDVKPSVIASTFCGVQEAKDGGNSRMKQIHFYPGHVGPFDRNAPPNERVTLAQLHEMSKNPNAVHLAARTIQAAQAQTAQAVQAAQAAQAAQAVQAAQAEAVQAAQAARDAQMELLEARAIIKLLKTQLKAQKEEAQQDGDVQAASSEPDAADGM